MELKGLCDIMGGKYTEIQPPDPLSPSLNYPGGFGFCDPAGWEKKHIKLPDVTAIFPSITFASWASIYTGKLPNETGILGQEFFARDLIRSNDSANTYYWAGRAIPGLESLPPGFVALDATGITFKPERGRNFAFENVIPVEFSVFGIHGSDTLAKKLNASAPGAALTAETLWSNINTLVAQKYQTSGDNLTSKCETTESECRTVSISNQYAMSMPAAPGGVSQFGADRWATPDSTWQSIGQIIRSFKDAAKIMDKSAAAEGMDFLDHYFDRKNPSGKRKRFPALFSMYLSGLDHEAHAEGMETYQVFFKNMTDSLLESFVRKLKDKDEFDNKIFIVVADHGHTAMPTDFSYVHENTSLNVETDEFIGIGQSQHPAEMSCELKTNFTDDQKNTYAGLNARNAEKENNNLHIWELGLMFQQLDPAEGWKLLVPRDIEQAIISGLTNGETAAVTSDISQANVIAALNGPMAHLYVKGAGGWKEANSDAMMLGKIADKLRMYFAENGVALRRTKKEMFNKILLSIDRILLRINGNYMTFKGLSVNEDGSIGGLATPGPLSELGTNQDYVNAAMRVGNMNNPSRSGDIILLMKDSSDEQVDTRYTTGVACKAWHGSLNKPDSFVPFIVGYPGGNRQELEITLKVLCPSNACEGNWVIPNLLNEIVELQYKDQ